jgi:hypothetical protein
METLCPTGHGISGVAHARLRPTPYGVTTNPDPFVVCLSG